MELMMLRSRAVEERPVCSGPDMEEQVWRNFPADVMERVTLYLPLNALFRFRCVCRLWRAMLSTPERVKLCATTGGRALPEGLLMARDNPSFRSCLPLHLVVSTLHIPAPLEEQHKDLVPCSTSRGLICFWKRTGQGLWPINTTLFVCNPFARTWKKLPEPDSRVRADCIVLVAGEAYESYKVYTTDVLQKICIYHSGRDAWTASIRVSNIVSHLVLHDGQLLQFSLAQLSANNGRLPPGAAGNTLVRHEDLLSVYELPRYNGFWFPVSDIVEHHGSVFFVGVGHLRRPRDEVKTCCVYELDEVTRGWNPLAELDLVWLEESCDDIEVQVLGLGSHICISVFCTLGIHTGFLSACGSTWDSNGNSTRRRCSGTVAYDMATSSWYQLWVGYHDDHVFRPFQISVDLQVSLRVP